jgi:hypothetical protein
MVISSYKDLTYLFRYVIEINVSFTLFTGSPEEQVILHRENHLLRKRCKKWKSTSKNPNLLSQIIET